MIGKSWENHCAASCTFAAVLTSRIPERLNRKEHGKSHGSTTVHKVPTANKHQKKTSCVYKSVRIRILYVYNRSDLETSPLAPIAVTKGCLRLSKGPGWNFWGQYIQPWSIHLWVTNTPIPSMGLVYWPTLIPWKSTWNVPLVPWMVWELNSKENFNWIHDRSLKIQPSTFSHGNSRVPPRNKVKTPQGNKTLIKALL